MVERSTFISDDIINRIIGEIALAIKNNYQPDCIVGVGDGGLEFSNRLSKHIGIDSKDIIHYIRYKTPDIKVKGKKVLICDDVVNSGDTLKGACYNIQSLRPKDIKTAALLVCEKSGIIPNFYCIEREAKERFILPWKSFPIRSYPQGIIHRISWDYALEFLSIDLPKGIRTSRPKYWETYSPQAYAIIGEKEKCTVGVVCFYENKDDNELFIVLIAPTIPNTKNNDWKKILSVLWEMVNNYGNYHGFDKITHVVHETKRTAYEHDGFTYVKNIEIQGVPCCEMCYHIHTGRIQ